MKVLITGAGGFIGKNLAASLKNHRLTSPGAESITVLECVRSTSAEELFGFCREADFVFQLAGVNRSENAADFHSVNCGFTARLLEMLKKAGNRCPVMLASSVQAGNGSPYGQSKLAAEKLLIEYSAETGAKALIYRLPNVFGKWCRPDYNSAVATFCHNIARGLPISVNEPDRELELLYVDDLAEELLLALEGREHRADGDCFCQVPATYRVKLGETARLIRRFCRELEEPNLKETPEGSFEKKLRSAFISYLPAEKLCCNLSLHADERGSFAELLRSEKCGQLSVSVTAPGCTRGNHWHHSKWECFAVVSGEGLVRQRRVDSEEVLELTLTGSAPKWVRILPGYTHSITNLSPDRDLVTIIWANENFDPLRPDTCYEEV